MHKLLLGWSLAMLVGCTSYQNPQFRQLEIELRVLRQDVAEISQKLDKTNQTAKTASAKAVKTAAQVDKVNVKAEEAKTAADKALDASSMSPPTESPRSLILQPREINHETTILP